MQTLKQADAPFLSALLAWIAYRVARVRAALAPEHSAVAVAALVARSGNPSGV